MLYASAFLLSIGSAGAQTITEVQNFNFGTWAVTNNQQPRYVTVAVDGSYTNDPQMIMIQPPLQGVYNVTGLPPNAVILSVLVTMSAPLTSSGEQFTVDNFTTHIPNADINGETQLVIGGRVRSSGTSNGYDDSTYTGQIDIDINF